MWSTATTPERGEDGMVHVQKAGAVTLATIDLTTEDHQAFYLGYANGVLWPVFHYRLDLADFDAGFIDGYRRVNRMFAQKLLPLLRPDDVIWVHDYHLIPLAAELRALGCRQRIGFFLHIPLPPPQILSALPAHEWLMRALFAYDLVGVQSQTDLSHLHRYLSSEAPAEIGADGRLIAYGRSLRADSFPIGIDVDEFIALAEAPEARDMHQSMREQFARRQLLVGVDRLDYSKGLPHRIRAFRHLLERYPENRGSATLVQVASPSREDVEAYNDIRRELEGLCGAINGDFGEIDWMPIRYIHRTVGREEAARAVPRRPGGAGDAAARRHEPGGQGVRRLAATRGSGRAGAVAVCRRRRAVRGRPAGQPVRHAGHGRSDPGRAADAARRTPDPARAHAAADPPVRHPLVAQAVSRDAGGGLR